MSTRGTFCLDYVYLFFHRKLHSMKKKLVFFKNASDDMRKSKGEVSALYDSMRYLQLNIVRQTFVLGC